MVNDTDVSYWVDWNSYEMLFTTTSLPLYTTTCHFHWPCAIFADTGVFKLRITILKSMQFVAFLWDFSQITSNHQSNTKNNI